MAGGDYGAYTFRNGALAPDRHMPVFPGGTETVDGCVLAREEWAFYRHAVLGEGLVRLAAYKTILELWRRGPDGDVAQVPLDPYVTRRVGGEVVAWRGECEGAKFTAVLDLRARAIDLELVEADGTRWTARSGWHYGPDSYGGPMSPPAGVWPAVGEILKAAVSADLGDAIRATLKRREHVFPGMGDERRLCISDWCDNAEAALLAVLDLRAVYQTIGPIMLPGGIEERVRLAEYAAYQEALGLAVSAIAEKLGIEVGRG